MKKSKNNTQLTETQKQELDGYAAEVNLLQTKIVSNDNIAANLAKTTFELAIKAGNYLRKAKKLAGHGNWQKWVKENVPSISKKTVENYMRVAEEAEADASFFSETEGLRQAYVRVGICNAKPESESVEAEAVNPETESSDSPTEIKKTNKGQYDNKRNEVRQKAISHVREAITGADKVNWNLSAWTVINDKPCSDEEANYGAALFEILQEWVSKREHKDLRPEDEISTKTGVVLNEVVKSFILANQTTGANISLSQIAPDFAMELNPERPEVAETVAA